jgi:hypothetical protein
VFRIIEGGLEVRVSVPYSLVRDDLRLEEEVFWLLGWRCSKVYGVVLEASSFGSAVCFRKRERALFIGGNAGEEGRGEGAISS